MSLFFWRRSKWDYIGRNISYILEMFGLYFEKDFASENFFLCMISKILHVEGQLFLPFFDADNLNTNRIRAVVKG